MKQFIFAKTIVSQVPSGGAVTTDGQLVVTNTTGADFLQLTVGRGAMNVPDTFVVYKKNMHWSKTAYRGGIAFTAEITCGFTSGKINETYVVISKQGAVFNERNVWTASGQGSSATAIAKKLADNINKSTATHGLTATVSGSKVTLNVANNNFESYSIVANDVVIDPVTNAITESASTVSLTSARKPIGDEAYVKNLAHQCIGDKGIGYTYNDVFAKNTDNVYVDNLNVPSAGCDIITIKCYNPRFDHRIDEPLVQTIHVAVPTGNTSLTALLADTDANTAREESAGPATE